MLRVNFKDLFWTRINWLWIFVSYAWEIVELGVIEEISFDAEIVLEALEVFTVFTCMLPEFCADQEQLCRYTCIQLPTRFIFLLFQVRTVLKKLHHFNVRTETRCTMMTTLEVWSGKCFDLSVGSMTKRSFTHDLWTVPSGKIYDQRLATTQGIFAINTLIMLLILVWLKTSQFAETNSLCVYLGNVVLRAATDHRRDIFSLHCPSWNSLGHNHIWSRFRQADGRTCRPPTVRSPSILAPGMSLLEIQATWWYQCEKDKIQWR